MRGSVIRRGKAWRAVIDLPRGRGGTRQQRSKTFETRRAAEEWLARTTLSAHGSADNADRITVEQFLELWLEAVLPALKPNTALYYRRAVERINGALGGVKLQRLTALDVQRAINGLVGHHAEETMRGTLARLRTALRRALEWGYLSRDPTLGVVVPRGPRREMGCWNEEEARRFLGSIGRRSRYATLFRVALATGMRLGEILGLRWEDVDWKAADLHVRRSLSWPVGGSPELLEPKTGSSSRRISLDAPTLEALRRYRIRQAAERLRAGECWKDLQLVFTTRTGCFVPPRDVRAILKREMRVAEVLRIRFHDLRHTHATLLLRQGRNIKEVADRLGHANPATLLRRYAHVLPDQRAETARVIGEVLGSCDHL